MKVSVIDLYTSSIDDNQNIDNELKAAEKWEVKVLMRDGSKLDMYVWDLLYFS